VIAATTEAEVRASESEAAKLAGEDAHTTWRLAARKTTGNVATVELHRA